MNIADRINQFPFIAKPLRSMANLIRSTAKQLASRINRIGSTADPIAITPQPVCLPADPPAPFAEVLRGFERTLSGLLRPIKARPLYVPGARQRKWRKYMPRLARSCADVMDTSHLLFADFGYRGQHLRDLEQEVHQVGLLLGFLVAATKEVKGIYLNRKQELADKTMQVADQVRTVKDLPAAAPELREEARQGAQPIEAVLNKSNQQVQHTRRERAHLRAQAEEQTEAAQRELVASRLEGHVLRGGRLSGEVLARVHSTSAG